MKKETFNALIIGAYSASVASKAGFGVTDFKYWLISVGVVILLLSIYHLCKDGK